MIRTFRWRLNIGKRENHSTANDNRPNTSKLVSNLEANRTEAKIAALVDSDPGILFFCNELACACTFNNSRYVCFTSL